MVGLPSSGKTTWVRENTHNDRIVCSADHWHECMLDGSKISYDYKVDEEHLAHTMCWRKFCWALRSGTRYARELVVDNTNLAISEIAPYVTETFSHGYRPEIIWVNENEGVCRDRNAERDRVPPLIMVKMIDKLNALVDQWPQHWPPLTRVWDYEDHTKT